MAFNLSWLTSPIDNKDNKGNKVGPLHNGRLRVVIQHMFFSGI